MRIPGVPFWPVGKRTLDSTIDRIRKERRTRARGARANLAGNRSQKLASDQLRLLAREIQAPVQGEVQVLCIPIGAHETGGRVAVREQQVAYLVGHSVREHN